ncbi:MAG TPA: putative O-glycosylation ligase, exosortase A system-associated [Candidatus Eisenbacteria bacterium]
MSIRDLLLSAILVASVPVCFRRPWIGVLIYSWIGYMNPHKLTWGVAYSFPWAFLAILATTAGLAFTRDRKPVPITRETVLLVLLWVVFLLSTATSAFYPEDAWPQFEKVSKILFGTFITLVVLQDLGRVRLLLWVIALSLGFYGLKGGLFAIATRGQYQVLGPANTFIAGNTEIGLALNMVLPFLWILRRELKRRWLRLAMTAVFFLSVIASLITYSRGALLGLLAVVLLLVVKNRGRWIAIPLLTIGVTVSAAVLPDSWTQRMETIADYQEDGSAMGRINAWRLSWHIASDRPLLGAGFQPFTERTYARYLPEVLTSSTDAHNIFFQVLAEHGFVGLGVFAALVGSTMLTLGRVQRRARRNPALQRLADYAQIIEASMVGYVVSGFFLSRSYFDLFYSLVAITILLSALLRAAERAPAVASVGAGAAAPGSPAAPSNGSV